MDNNLLRLKLRQRLNKLASNDFTNLECWQEAELINKAQIQWSRRNLHGGNQYREGDEQSIIRVDDFQILLNEKLTALSNHTLYYETDELPENYFKYKRIAVLGYTKTCKEPRRITVRLTEEANVNDMLADYLVKPSFKWAETFATLINNHIRIYTNGEFLLKDCNIIYYRFPTQVVFEGCRDWNDNVGADSPIEFKDDIAELIIDEAVKIAAADMNDFNNYSRSEKAVEEDN